MKTLNFRLIATTFTLAAVTLIATMPAEAQSRKDRDEKEGKKEVRDTRKRIADKPIRETPDRKIKESNYKAEKSQPENKAATPDNHKTRPSGNNDGKNRDGNNWQERNRDNRGGNATTERGRGDRDHNPPENDRDRHGNDRFDNGHGNRYDNGGDRRDYNHRPVVRENHPNRHHYDYSWNRDWERNRWDTPRWKDYYKHYHPFWFRDYKYYYHHPRYGHVIKRFDFKPFVFRYRDIPYYYYDGSFFTYRRGIGYIYVDTPIDIVFSELPFGFERVYLNGVLYFRVGDLFFELFPDGFRLVHYPGKYFSYR